MERDDAILSYLQDRLDPLERKAFEKTLTEDPSLAAEVEVMRAVRDEMKAGPKHQRADEVWDRVSVAMNAAAPAANDNRRPFVALLKYAAVAVIAVAAWQFTVGPRLGNTQDGFRAVSEQNAEFVLQVRFVDSATITEIGSVLTPLGATITDGPGALGILRLSFADAPSRDAAREALASQSEIVELVLE
ncbi:MAG: hypothetical protein AAF922_21215 [Pseudomonadota bacterium]